MRADHAAALLGKLTPTCACICHTDDAVHVAPCCHDCLFCGATRIPVDAFARHLAGVHQKTVRAHDATFAARPTAANRSKRKRGRRG